MNTAAGLKLNKVNDEVFVAEEQIVRLSGREISFLKQHAASNARGRARICAHRTKEDALHEMIIAISAQSYIHPHKHLEKSESFHIIEGEVNVVMFDDRGGIVDIIELGEAGSGRNFYYRLSNSVFHTLLIHTDFLVVHAVTNAPFDRDKKVLAPFAPPEEQLVEAQTYMQKVATGAADFMASSGKR